MIMDIEKRLDQAVAFHQAGQLSKAERLYQQVLADNPRNADALHLLGVVAYQVGRHEIAVNLITHAIEIDPQQVEAYNNLGIVFKEQKKSEKSIQTYHKAIEINPDHAEAHYNLGMPIRNKENQRNRFKPIIKLSRYSLIMPKSIIISALYLRNKGN